MTATANTTRARLKADVRPFRPVAVQLLKMAGDPSAPFGKLAALVQTDPVLAMELLKMANSPLFRRRVEIESVLQAIVFLGSDMVSSLVLTAITGMLRFVTWWYLSGKLTDYEYPEEKVREALKHLPEVAIP